MKSYDYDFIYNLLGNDYEYFYNNSDKLFKKTKNIFAYTKYKNIAILTLNTAYDYDEFINFITINKIDAPYINFENLAQ
jgi:hypothetical protein